MKHTVGITAELHAIRMDIQSLRRYVLPHTAGKILARHSATKGLGIISSTTGTET